MQIFSVSESVNVTALMPYTTYLCIVAASTAIGRGPFSTVTTVQTLEAGIKNYTKYYLDIILVITTIFLGRNYIRS